MKKKIILTLLIAIIPFLNYPSVLAQDEKLDEFTFEDETIQEPKQPYFALSVGVTGSFLFMNYDDINSKFILPRQLEELSGPMFMMGVNIFAATSPIINNARIGFIYQSGSKSSERDTTTLVPVPLEYSGSKVLNDPGVLVTNYYSKLSVQETGFHVDYAFMPIKSLAILPGIAVKWGTMTFEEFATVNPVSWNSTILTNANQQLKHYYMSFEPQVSVDYALTGFLMLRANAGYSFTINDPLSKYAWVINGNNEYKDVPNSVKSNGFVAQIGIFLGLFNY